MICARLVHGLEEPIRLPEPGARTPLLGRSPAPRNVSYCTRLRGQGSIVHVFDRDIGGGLGTWNFNNGLAGLADALWGLLTVLNGEYLLSGLPSAMRSPRRMKTEVAAISTHPRPGLAAWALLESALRIGDFLSNPVRSHFFRAFSMIPASVSSIPGSNPATLYRILPSGSMTKMQGMPLTL